MLKRSVSGKLRVDELDLQIFLGELFSKCQTEEEVEWVQDKLQEYMECSADERCDEIYKEEDEDSYESDDDDDDEDDEDDEEVW